MFGVCYKGEGIRMADNAWAHVLDHFGVTEIYERGDSPYGPLVPTIHVKDAAGLPADRPIVVAAPKTGAYVKGDINLVGFEHPDNAIYFFGTAWDALEFDEELGERRPDYSVYIPSAHHELFPFDAAAIIFYDRYIKRGDFG